MDVSSSSAATLTRPRVVIQVLAGVTGVFIAWQFWQQFRLPHLQPATSSSSSASVSGGGSGLQRSNAVRRTERSTRRQIQAALDDVEHRLGSDEREQIEHILNYHFGRQLADHPGAAASAPDDAESPDHDTHHDENAENTNSRPPATPGDVGGEADTVAGEERTMEDDWAHDDVWNTPPPRAGHNIVGLLFRVSEDNARRNAYVHRGCMCNACGLLPIRGIRYRCANCADFDLCETCESQGLHIKTHVFYKVKVPAPPFGPKSMQPVWYPGDPDTALRNLPGSLIRHLAKETGFERPELEALWEQWTFIANTEWRDDPDELFLAADRKTFERYLVPSSGHRRTAPNLIHDRMFAFYDTNGDDLISFPEFLMGLSYKKGKQRLERIFKGYDVDGDGYISRRDCLRIFRTYYVLYKHMHGDVLEGLDQQVMNNTETQQLVTGRQPLSSHFGREGRVPEADHGRPMEGKIFHGNGDVWVSDKNGVVNESRTDVGDRGEILSSLFNHAGPSDDAYGRRFFTPASEHVTSPTDEDVSRIYSEALLNPPTRVEELVSLLHGEPRNIQPSELAPVDRDEQQDGEGNGAENVPSEEETSAEEEEEESAAEDVSRSVDYFPSFADASRGSSSAPQVVRDAGSERWTNRPPTDSQLRAQHLRLEAHKKRTMDRKLRVTVRKKLFDRWKKRNFYLAEEEGNTPPEGWNEEDDVLADINGTEAAGSSKEGQPPLSARSRSSSKVRFAEDTDDYEIRSNPSTSSRSVPERWGGMEIPDAEKDMGKEILYVVTQQAFNELLDVLFKEKEDLAVKAAETREYREAYRDLLDSFDQDKGKKSSQHQDENRNGSEENREGVKEHENEPEKTTVIEVDEKKPVQDRTLDELLATSGYTVDETLAFKAEEDEEETTSEDEESVETSSIAEEQEPSTSDIPYRDPTMPQFRPNSDADVPPVAPVTGSAHHPKPALKSRRPGKLRIVNGNGSAGSTPARPGRKVPKPLTRPPEAALLEWRKHDAAEKEAKERGGWGRLNLAEFKDIWHREESGPHRLDYMGTWIDFCIP